MCKQKILVIVGPTASGKTKLAIELAKKYNGEIISADSMQIYKEMSIATAKPTKEEQEGIPHHLMDFLPLDKPFNLSDYLNLAKQKIKEISDRGKLPIIAGGTGLYINSLIDNIKLNESEQDENLRNELYRQAKQDNGESLYKLLCEIDPESAKTIHQNNTIRLVRAIEIYKLTGKTMTEHKLESKLEPSPYDVCIIGLNYEDREKLYEKINLRVDIMLKNGLEEEVRQVYNNNKNLKTAYNAIGYKELIPYIEGQDSLENCIEKIKQESRRYAKRQLTWFRRDKRINWIYVDKEKNFKNIIKKSDKIIETFISL